MEGSSNSAEKGACAGDGGVCAPVGRGLPLHRLLASCLIAARCLLEDVWGTHAEVAPAHSHTRPTLVTTRPHEAAAGTSQRTSRSRAHQLGAPARGRRTPLACWQTCTTRPSLSAGCIPSVDVATAIEIPRGKTSKGIHAVPTLSSSTEPTWIGVNPVCRVASTVCHPSSGLAGVQRPIENPPRSPSLCAIVSTTIVVILCQTCGTGAR